MDYITKEELVSLVNLGYVACSKGKVLQGRNLFTKLNEAYPQKAAIIVGIAFSHLVVDEFDACDSLITDVVKQEPDNYDALAMQAFSFALQKREAEAKEIIEKIPESSTSAYNLGKASLALLQSLMQN